MEDRSVLSRQVRPPDVALPQADVYLGAASRPVVVLIHGGFWRPEYDRTHLRPLASALADVGWPVLSVEYRRVPGHPQLTVVDVQEAVDSVHKDMILMGHSAGGHLALLADSPRVIGTIALAPVADLDLAHELALDDGAVDDFLGGHERSGFQPAKADAVLVHGDEDTLVPIRLSEVYQRRHPSVRLRRVGGVAHFELIDPASAAWPVVIEELERLLA